MAELSIPDTKPEPRAVLLFTLDPDQERKSGPSNNDKISRFLWSVIGDVIESVRRLRDTQLFITVGEEGGRFQKRVESLIQGWSDDSPRPIFIPFSGNQFGTNLKESVKRVLDLGYTRVAVVANDSPFCDPAVFRRTFDLLDANADAVLGPTRDGGLYLLGFRAGISCLDGVPWKSADVFRAIGNCLAASGYTFELLPVRMDVDRFTDLYLVRVLYRTLRTHFQRLIRKLLEVFVPFYIEPPGIASPREVWFRLIFQKSPPLSFSR
jgi:hypothetical protein